MYQYIFQRLIKRLAKKAAYQILTGRLIDKGCPECGRFLRRDVNAILKQIWQNVDELLPEAHLEKIPTEGNRLNLFLAVVTVAAYHAFLQAGVEKDYAIELFADIGWRVYTKFLPFPQLVSRLATRDPRKRVNIILRMFMIFPFSIPGRPGYECKAKAETDHFCTYWTHCPPFEFVRQYVEAHGDRGELKAFQRSWCWYDWALTYAMVNGSFKVRGHYERPHTLSEGDDICDMRWYAQVPSNTHTGVGVRSEQNN
jgi:hypothetical protein